MKFDEFIEIICGEPWFNQSTKMFHICWKLKAGDDVMFVGEVETRFWSCFEMVWYKVKHKMKRCMKGFRPKSVNRCKQCVGHVCLQHRSYCQHCQHVIHPRWLERITRPRNGRTREVVRCFNFHLRKRSGDDVGGCCVDHWSRRKTRGKDALLWRIGSHVCFGLCDIKVGSNFDTYQIFGEIVVPQS